MFGADVVDQPGRPLPGRPCLLHLCGLVLVVAVLVPAAPAPALALGSTLVSRVLVVGMLLDLAAYLIGQQATDLTSARYLLPFLGFGAVLAGGAGGCPGCWRASRASPPLLCRAGARPRRDLAVGAVTAQPAPAASGSNR